LDEQCQIQHEATGGFRGRPEDDNRLVKDDAVPEILKIDVAGEVMRGDRFRVVKKVSENLTPNSDDTYDPEWNPLI
jgi:hypothetical protein